VLSGGRIVEDGSPDAFISSHHTAYSKLFSDAPQTVESNTSESLL
jgi:ABC-type multidrug transport system fused ATPase/permease subunit